MKTLREILEQRETILSLIQKFGFSAEARVFFDRNRDPEETEKKKLVLVITKEEDKVLPWNNSTLLNVKLSSELKCEVSVTPVKAVPALTGQYLLTNSVPLTDENALCSLFGVTDTEAVSFADTETPNVKVLKNANDYLNDLEESEKKSSSAKNLSHHAVVSESAQKRSKLSSSEESDNPQLGNTESPPKISTPSSTRK